MNNDQIAIRLNEIAQELEDLQNNCMHNNHVAHERLNALLEGNIVSAIILLKRTAAYLP